MLAALGLAIFFGLKVKCGLGVVITGVAGLPAVDSCCLLPAQLNFGGAPTTTPGDLSSERLTVGMRRTSAL